MRRWRNEVLTFVIKHRDANEPLRGMSHVCHIPVRRKRTFNGRFTAMIHCLTYAASSSAASCRFHLFLRFWNLRRHRRAFVRIQLKWCFSLCYLPDFDLRLCKSKGCSQTSALGRTEVSVEQTETDYNRTLECVNSSAIYLFISNVDSSWKTWALENTVRVFFFRLFCELGDALSVFRPSVLSSSSSSMISCSSSDSLLSLGR